MGSKAKKLIGVARINEFYGHKWHDFTLDRGTFFGQLEGGTFFVSNLERRKSDNFIKVYLCTPSLCSDKYQWKMRWADPTSKVATILMKALPKRRAMGINKVEKQPLNKQKTGYNPELTTTKPVPYAPMRIPCPGSGSKHSHFVNPTK